MKKISSFVMIFLMLLSVFTVVSQMAEAQTTEDAILYAGGSNPGVVYKYVGGTEWEVISPDLGYAVLCLVEYDGDLYAGIRSFSSHGQVYRYDGGTSWTLIGDNMDRQVGSLAVYQDDLFAGTGRNGMKLYKYIGGTSWTQLIPSPIWTGTRSLHVSHGYLLMGDAGYDRFGRWDGSNFYADHSGGGSCIWDYEDYNDNVYASAYYGRLWQSPDAINWNVALDYDWGKGDMWELEVFQDSLYMGYDNGDLMVSNVPDRGTLVYTAPDGIISMETDDENLYFGTGGEAGYRGQTSGIASVYKYDGISVERISDEDEMQTGVQVLYVLPVHVEILPVPYYYQGSTDWCLPTSMSMIFKYYGQNTHFWDIAKDWGWSRDIQWWEFWDTWDMMAWNVESYFEEHGLVAEYMQYLVLNPIDFDIVSTWIDTRGPVLLALTFPINHAVVVVGYDTSDETVYVNDPSGALLEEIFPVGELPNQPYTAIELSWDEIPIPWLSWAMVVEGSPSPPSGTIDIQDYGVRFWHRDRRWPPGVYSWLYGRDKGLIWEHSEDHPLAVNSRDQFQFWQYIVNHMEDSQTYVLEIDFVSERVPLTPVSGKGIWITYIWDTNNDGKIDYGNVGSILKRLKSVGVSWVIIKCGDSDSYWLTEGRTMNEWLKGSGYESFTQVINEFHNVGIKVFGGHYVYSYDRHNIPDLSEADVSNIILDIPGIDGLIIDAETEYEFAEESGEKAREYLSLIRLAHPHSFIAYTTFGNPRSHISFPYVEFGKYCNVAMPQVYWIDWGITPAEAVATMKAQWNELYENWERDGKSDSIKPIIPMGQSSDVTGTTPAKKGEITEFCKAVHKSGYEGVSIFRYGKMQEDHWREYAKSLLPLCFTVSIEARNSKSNIMGPISLRDLLKYPGQYTVTLRLWNEDCTEKYDEVVFPSIKYSLLIEFYLASPADLYVTDPGGFHVGVDPSTGQLVNEILGAVYTGPGSDPQVIAIPDPLDGNYEVRLIGTATGNYFVTTELVTLQETITQIYTGEIVEGAVYVYSVTLGDGVMTANPDPVAELEHLKEFIGGLTDGSFDEPRLASQRKNALFNKIDEVILKVEAGNYTDAVNKLFHDIRAKMDGDSTAQDWIIDPEMQTSLCIIIDHIISSIETLQPQPD